MRIFRAIIAGILGGAALFFLPFFILRLFLFILFISLAIRLIVGVGFGRRGGYWRGRGFNPMFADKIRSMSEEEYNGFKQKFSYGCGRRDGFDDRRTTEATTEKQSS